MALDDFIVPDTVSRGIRNIKDEETDANPFVDSLKAIPRGIEGAVQGTYDAVDKLLLGDHLPDYDKRFLGKSETMAGSIIEGGVQFLTGFVPIVGQVGKAGQIARLAKVVGSRRKALQVLKGSASLSPVQHKAVNALKTKKSMFVEGAAAGAATDFLVFDAQEQRLSNLIEQFPALQNPVSQYLAAAPTDTELEGRFKNMLEGLFIEGGVGLGASVFNGIKLLKNRKDFIAEGRSVEDASQAALEKSPLTEEDIIREPEVKAQEGVFDGETGKQVRAAYPLYVQGSQPLNRGYDDIIESGGAVPLEKFISRLTSDSAEFGASTARTSKDVKIDEQMIGFLSELVARNPEQLRDLQVKIVEPEDMREFGLYEFNENNLDIQRVTLRRDSHTSTIVHEFVHAVSSRKIDAVTKTYKTKDVQRQHDIIEAMAKSHLDSKVQTGPVEELASLYIDVLKLEDINKHMSSGRADLPRAGDDGIIRTHNALKFNLPYGFNDLEEFMAETIADTNFQNILASYRIEDGRVVPNQGGKSLLDKFKDIIGKLINKPANSETVLDRMFEVSQDIIDESEATFKALGDSRIPPTGRTLAQEDIPSPPRGAEDTEKEFQRYFSEQLKTGGIQAIYSALRTVGTSGELLNLSRVFARHFAETGTVDAPISDLLKSTREEVVNMTEVLNTKDSDRWLKEIKRHEGDVATLRKIRGRAKSLYMLQQRAAENLSVSAKEALGILNGAKEGNYEKAKIQVLRELEIFGELQRIWGLTGREQSFGLLSRQAMYRNGAISPKAKRTQKIQDNQFNFSDSLMDNQGARRDYIERTQNSMNMDDKKFLELISIATSTDDMEKALGKLSRLRTKSKLQMGFDMVREYWINALLSGPSTQVVNTMGNVLTLGLRQMETAVGAAITGDTALVRASLDVPMFFDTIRESFDMAAASLRAQEGITVGKNNTSFIDRRNDRGYAITTDNLGELAQGTRYEKALHNSTFGKVFDTMGKVLRTPSTALLVGDEFFKSMSYRLYIKTEVATLGYQKGLRGKQLAEYVVKEMDNHITNRGAAFNEQTLYAEANQIATDEGLTFSAKTARVEELVEGMRAKRDSSDFDEEVREALAKRAEQYSLINTFTADIEDITKVPTGVPEFQSLVQKQPLLSFVVPFVRTPANILAFGLGRTPVGALKSGHDLLKMRIRNVKGELSRADARRRSEIYGQLTTSASTLGALLYYMGANKNVITGYGPSEKKERAAWKKAGNQEYSVKVGNKWVSYQRLDPMASTLGIMADLHDLIDNNEIDGDNAQKVFTMMIMVFKNNITNKSYVQGIDSLFKVIADTESYGGAFAGRIAGGFVPNFFNQLQNMEDERLMREARRGIDYLHKRNPLKSDTLPVKRDPLGDPLRIKTGGGAFGLVNPLYIREINDNFVDNELLALGGVSRPSNRMAGGQINMKNYKNEEGREAYDRFEELAGKVKINGMTLRQSLDKLMRSPRYQKLPDDIERGEFEIDSPRYKEVQRLLRSYRNEAKLQTFKEFPELRRDLDIFYNNYNMRNK